MITKERYEMLIQANRGGANLSMRDFAAIDEYEKHQGIPVSGLISTKSNAGRRGRGPFPGPSDSPETAAGPRSPAANS